MLEILAKKVGGFVILDNFPQFLSQALSFIGSNALANPIGKALFSIYSMILTEWSGNAKSNISCDSELAEKWTQLWAEPTRQALLNEKMREHIQTYFLPQMFKRLPQSLAIFIKPMTEVNFNTSENEISILLGCMKLGQERGILDVLKEENGIITEEFLESLLHHESSVLRIGALSLISSSQQVTKPVAKYVFKVLERSLDDFFIESDPGFRNQFYGFIRQFIFRVRASSYSINKEAEKQAKKGDLEQSAQLAKEVDLVHEFFVWLISYLERCLRPSAPYQYRFTSMLLVQLLVNSGLDDEIRPECYEKQHDFFPFKLPVYNKNIVRLLMENIANNYEDVRATAANIIKIAKLPLPLIESYTQIDTLASQSLATLSGMRGREGDAGARGLELAFNLYFNFPVSESNANTDRGLRLFEEILGKLEEEIAFANKNMAIAVREHPIHGYFTALGFILESLDFYKFANTSANQQHWRLLVERIVQCINDVWINVKDILCHDSPEGNLPKEFEANYEPELEAQYGPATQVILSYSWRAIKESTTMLKILFDRVPLIGQSSSAKKSATPAVIIDVDIFPNEIVVQVGDLLLTQLSTVRHRGAFSSIYPTFIACCKRCNRTTDLKAQPEKWLSDNINLIKVKAQYVTRRSGGFPYLITAVLTAELEPTMDLITATFGKLLEIAKTPATSTGEDRIDLPQVHAFNCIKALFIETNLSTRSAYFIEPALELAIVSFSSDIWAIRNCAVMLFTALQNRLFGTAKPTKSKHTNSTTSAKIFFNKYKSIRGTLLQMLQNYVNHIDDTSSQVEIVFPILSLLSRLESTVGYTGLDEFKPLIIACLSSKIWKVREMTARVIPPLLKDQDTLEFLVSLIDGASLKNQNQLHGVFLAGLNIVISLHDQYQAKKVLEAVGLSESEKSKKVLAPWFSPAFVTFLLARFHEFVVVNPSPETALAYARIAKEVYFSALNDDSLPLPDEFRSVLVAKCQQLWKNVPGSSSQQLSSARRMLQSELAETVLVDAFSKNSSSSNPLEIVNSMILCFESYEVQLMALEFLDSHIEYLTGANSASVLHALWDVFVSQAWDQVRGPAARLFSQIFARFSEDVSSQSFREATDVPKYWKVLFESVKPGQNTEEINESCLEALGIFTGQIYNSSLIEDSSSATAQVAKWIDLVKKFSDENEAYPSRDAALTSLLAFLSTIKKPTGSNLGAGTYSSAHLTIYVDVILQLFFFLSDDDEDIRRISSEYVSRMLNLRFLATVAHSENMLLFDYLVGELSMTSSVIHDYALERLFSYLTDEKASPEKLFADAQAVDDTLFIYEKQNLFRDEVYKFEQVGRAITQLLSPNKHSVPAQTQQIIQQWVSAASTSLEATLEALGGDDSLLVWSKDPKVAKEVSRAGIAFDVYKALGINHFQVDGRIAKLNSTESVKAMFLKL